MRKNFKITNRKIAALLAVLVLLCGCNRNATAQTTSKPKDKWVVKETNGSVFVYLNGKTVKKTNIVIISLPRSEAMKLKEGIEAENAEEVERIIELYES